MQTLAPIKDKLLLLCADSSHRVNSQSISETLQISPGHTRLVLKTVATSYKRLLPKGHKDSAAVADVWPSTSAFDGLLSALSPLQCASRSSRASRNLSSTNVQRGMLKLPAEDKHSHRKHEPVQRQKQDVASFARDWEPFNWTKQLT
nr:TBCC domain-containing protein 1-like [Ipomoea batatas]